MGYRNDGSVVIALLLFCELSEEVYYLTNCLIDGCILFADSISRLSRLLLTSRGYRNKVLSRLIVNGMDSVLQKSRFRIIQRVSRVL